MERRALIKGGCAGVFALAFGGAYISWGIRREDGRPDFTPEKIASLPEDMAAILYLASLAPSGHNTQPWLVNVKKPLCWSVGTASARWRRAADPDNREASLAVGAFIENLAVAAADYGYQTDITVTANDAFAEELAEIKLSALESRGKSGVGVGRIKERRALRKDFAGTPLREEDIAFLTEESGAIVYCPLASVPGGRISELVIEGSRGEAEDEAITAELAQWIRFNRREAKLCGDGLTPKSMEMDGIVKWYAENFMDKRDVGGDMFKKQSLRLAKEQAENCAGWFVVTSGGTKASDMIEAGRQAERLWLKARERRIAIHPMSQAFGDDRLRRELDGVAGEGRRVCFLLRAGYVGNYPPPVSLRLALKKIILP